MDQLSTGMGDLKRGFAALCAHPTCWKYIIAPAVLSALLLAAIVIGARYASLPMIQWATMYLPHWLSGIAGGLMTALVIIAVATGAVIVFVPIAGLISGPFVERLSEHLELAITGRAPSKFDFGEFIQGLVLSIGHGLRRVLASVGALILVVAIGGIPVIGTIAALVATAWFSARGAAYDSYDAVLGRRLYSYDEKMKYLARHRGRTTGLGAAVALLLIVPVLNLFALGLGAAGATVASLELEGWSPALPKATAIKRT